MLAVIKLTKLKTNGKSLCFDFYFLCRCRVKVRRLLKAAAGEKRREDESLSLQL